jgi:OHCU decarboxylase
VSAPLALAALNAMPVDAFVAVLGGVFEHSPWVAERVVQGRPFASVNALHATMLDAVRSAGPEEQLVLLRAHPELAGREAQDGTLTGDSTGEQGRLGFTSLSREECVRVAAANRAYRSNFGFPCIVALALHEDRGTVIAEMERRAAGSDRDAEIETALEQIGAITESRLRKLVTDR